MVTIIRAVLTPATGSYDPVPLRIPQKVGSFLRILQIDQKTNDLSSLNQALKLNFQLIKGVYNTRSSDQGSKIRPIKF